MRVVLAFEHDHELYEYDNIKKDFVTALDILINLGFSGFYERIKNHLKTDQIIVILFEDEDGDWVPIECEDEYYAFIQFLRVVNGRAKIFVIPKSAVVTDGNPGEELNKSPVTDKLMEKSVAASLIDPMSSDLNVGLPKPITPDPVRQMEEASSSKGLRDSARFVAELENNCDGVINQATEKFLKKDETQSGNSVSAGDEVPMWLKQYLAEFRENLLEEVNCIIKRQCSNIDNDEARANESPEEDIQENIAGNNFKDFERSDRHMLKKLESIQIREKNLDDLMQKTKWKKMKIMEKVYASSCRVQSPRMIRRFAMDVKILCGLEPIQVKKGERFVKVWQITNTGTQPWTKQTEFRINYRLRELQPGKYVVPCPTLEPDQVGSISVPFGAIGRPGSFKSIWSFFHMGQQFGPLVFCHVNVLPEPVEAKMEKSSEEVDKEPVVKPASSPISETDSDGSGDSIALIDAGSAVVDGENQDEETGFVVVPMPPCFFPDKPQDSAVNVVVKPGKKCETSQENGKDPTNTNGERGMKRKMSLQALKELLRGKHQQHLGANAQKKAADNKMAANGCSQTKPISEKASSAQSVGGNSSEYENMCNGVRAMSVEPGVSQTYQPTEAQWDDIQAYERYQESKLIKLFEEGKDAEGWQKYHELKMLKSFSDSLGRPNQYQVPAMVPDHNFGLPQHPFNPVQARYPVPPMPFQAGFINPPIIPRPNMIVPPLPPLLPHLAVPLPPPPPMFTQPLKQVPPSRVPFDLANSIYFKPSPYGRPIPSANDEEEPFQKLCCLNRGKSCIKNAKTNPNPAPANASCNPVDLSKRPGGLDSNTTVAEPNQSGNSFRFDHNGFSTAESPISFMKKIAEKKLANLTPTQETEMRNANEKAKECIKTILRNERQVEEHITTQMRNEKRGRWEHRATLMGNEESEVGEHMTNEEREVERSVETQMVNKEKEIVGAQSRPVPVASTDAAATAQNLENQPYVDILPESLVNGVISAVNTASSACATALNTLAQTRRQAAQPIDTSVQNDPKFDDSIALLYEMGFYNYEKNCCLLKKYNFVVEDVISHYCSNPNEI